MSLSECYINAISYYLPETVLDNKMINEQHPEWSIEKISSKTGIETRYISAKDEFSSDMAFKAVEKLFVEYNINREDIDYLILCTQTPDYFLPTTACILQDKLKLRKNIGALDFNLGCSGFVYGLGLAKGLVQTGQAKNILLVTSETYSKFIHPNDKANKTIFGDAAAATLISCNKIDGQLCASIGNFEYGTDGGGFENLIVKNGGMKFRQEVGNDNFNEEDGVFKNNDDYLYMDGKAIFNFTAFEVPGLISRTLEKNNILKENIDLFIFHQANKFMLDTVRKRSGIDSNKFYTNFSCANTVSSTIPIALKLAISEGNISTENKVLLAGFGVGLSMASTILNF